MILAIRLVFDALENTMRRTVRILIAVVVIVSGVFFVRMKYFDKSTSFITPEKLEGKLSETAWKPTEPVVTEMAQFFIDSKVVEPSEKTLLPLQKRIEVEILLPSLEKSSPGSTVFLLGFVVQVKDGRTLFSNSTVVKSVTNTPSGTKMTAKLISPGVAGEWKLAVYTVKRQPIAYSPPITVKSM